MEIMPTSLTISLIKIKLNFVTIVTTLNLFCGHMKDNFHHR